MNQIELLECPFCGGDAIVYEQERPVKDDSVWFRAGCNNDEDKCQCALVETAPYPTKRQAIEAWNTRSGQEGLVWITREEIKKLDIFEEILDALKECLVCWPTLSVQKAYSKAEKVINKAERK